MRPSCVCSGRLDTVKLRIDIFQIKTQHKSFKFILPIMGKPIREVAVHQKVGLCSEPRSA
jgi:hypothetical protein